MKFCTLYLRHDSKAYNHTELKLECDWSMLFILLKNQISPLFYGNNEATLYKTGVSHI